MLRPSHTDKRVNEPRTLGSDRTETHPVERLPAPELAGAAALGDLAVEFPRTELQRPTRILLVNADPVALRRIDAHLSGEGYVVSTLSTFQSAKELFNRLGPDLLVADIRLEAFNGLHLAARSRLDSPSLPVIITHASYDPVLETEAQRLGATFVVNPLENSEFLRHVRGALDKHRQVLPTSRP